MTVVGPRVHFLDPDKDSMTLVLILDPGDRVRVLCREHDVALDDGFPWGLTIVGSEPFVFTPPDDRFMEARWIIFEAGIRVSIRLDKLIDTTFRQYRDQLAEFYDYRSELLKRPTYTSTDPNPTRRTGAARIGRSRRRRGRRTTDGQ